MCKQEPFPSGLAGGSVIVLNVGKGVEIEKNDRDVTISNIQKGDILHKGFYHPGTREAVKLVFKGLRTTRLAGFVTSVDVDGSMLSVRPRGAEIVDLTITEATKIHKDDNEEATLADLGEGDVIVAVLYDEATGEAIRIVARSARLVSETRREATVEVKFTGPITEIGEGKLTLGGRTVIVNEDTEIEGELQVGLVVEVEGEIQPDGTIVAEEIEVKETASSGRR